MLLDTYRSDLSGRTQHPWMGGWFWVGEWMDDEGLGWLGGWIVMGRRMGDVWWIDG